MEIVIETTSGLALFAPLAAVAHTQASAATVAWAGINGDNVVDVRGNLRWWAKPRREASGGNCQSLECCSSPSGTRPVPQRIG